MGWPDNFGKSGHSGHAELNILKLDSYYLDYTKLIFFLVNYIYVIYPW